MRRLITFTILIFFAMSSFAQEMSMEFAGIIAKNFFYERLNLKKEVKIDDISISHCTIDERNGEDLFYAFNMEQGGFILISADKRAYPVLGYSFEGEWSNNMPPALLDLLDYYRYQIEEIKQNDLPASKSIEDTWGFYSGPSGSAKLNVMDVGPLLKTKWNQGCYYNNDCPSDAAAGAYLCYHVPVGCGATAMGQIMKYWEHPNSGSGSNTITSSYGPLSANFSSSTYNWSAMPNTLYSVNSQASKLLLHCGIASYMDYSPSGSGSTITASRNALVNNFGYQSSAQVDHKNGHSSTFWTNKLKAEMDLNQPAFYSGYGSSTGGGGHAFVCDGYQDGSTPMFHFNWGWGGSYNGYFSLSNLNPGSGIGGGSGVYTYNQIAIFGIIPQGMHSGIEEENKNSSLTIAPNPSNGVFSVEWKENSVDKIQVIDPQGRIIKEINTETYTNTIMINLKGQASGIYFLKSFSSENTKTHRINILH